MSDDYFKKEVDELVESVERLGATMREHHLNELHDIAELSSHLDELQRKMKHQHKDASEVVDFLKNC